MLFPFDNVSRKRAIRRIVSRLNDAGIRPPIHVQVEIARNMEGVSNFQSVVDATDKVMETLSASGFTISKLLAFEAISAYLGSPNWDTLSTALKKADAAKIKDADGKAAAARKVVAPGQVTTRLMPSIVESRMTISSRDGKPLVDVDGDVSPTSRTWLFGGIFSWVKRMLR